MRAWCYVLVSVLGCVFCNGDKASTAALADEMDKIEYTISSTRAGAQMKVDSLLLSQIGTMYVFEMINITNRGLARNAALLEKTMLAACAAANLTVIESKSHQFYGKGEGATAFILLAESHFSVHTWPEIGYVAADIFTCGEESKAKTAAAFLSTALGSRKMQSARIPRGLPGQLVMNQVVLSPAAVVEDLERRNQQGTPVNKTLAQLWADQLSNRDMHKLFGNTLADFDDIASHKSQYQLIEIIRNKVTKDTCLVLDNVVQICESYNAPYSEIYVHLPAAYLEKLETVLIIGGGDALALREVLKYKTVKRVVQLELDEWVTKLCAEHFGLNAHLPGGPDTDPRVEWRFGDAAQTIVDLINAGERFDLLLLDISETDPSGTVSTVDFFRSVAQALSPKGIFIKNENYQAATAELFDEYLEVIFPVPMITQQVFTLGSNGTSLLLPNFHLLEESAAETSFLLNALGDNFRQLSSMVRRYSRRGEYDAIGIKSGNSDARIPAQAGVACDDAQRCPCKLESLTDPPIVPVHEWRQLCVLQPRTEMKVHFTNLFPSALHLSWIFWSPDTEDETLEEPIFEKIAPGQTVTFTTQLGHKFVVKDAEFLLAKLARFTVSAQQVSHPFISYEGLHRPLVASRADVSHIRQVVLHTSSNE